MKTLKTFFFLLIAIYNSAFSNLDNIIPPEIINDPFYNTIVELASQDGVKTILEIGSSSGEGSTKAFVTGITRNPNKPSLFCLEVSKPRFRKLKNYFKSKPFVFCYNKSSVSLNHFPSMKEVEEFMESIPSPLNQYGKETVKSWLKADVDYILAYNKNENGIEFIKTTHLIENFDIVLIDGSEFTGAAELNFVYGSKYILLDDINTFKNYRNFQILSTDPNYELIEKNHTLRNGYAVFKKVCEI